MPIKPPPIGEKFGRLTVLGSVHIADDPRGGRYDWECRCDCGTHVVRRQHMVRSGHTTSCGCWAKERIGNMRRRHGMSHLPAYLNWQTMIQRCENPKNPHYRRYGARGIKVCDRWKVFENFYADMGERPSPDYSIDRIDNDGSYEPGNCRWATRRQQLLNTGRSKAKSIRLAVNMKDGTMTEEEFVAKRRELQVARMKWKGNRPMTSRLSNVIEQLENLHSPASAEHEAALRRLMAYQLNGIAQIMKDGGQFIREHHGVAR